MPHTSTNSGSSPAMGTEPAAILSALRDPETKIAAMLCSCVLKKLEYWYDTPLTYEQLTAALLSADRPGGHSHLDPGTESRPGLGSSGPSAGTRHPDHYGPS